MTTETLEKAKKLQSKIDYCTSQINLLDSMNLSYAMSVGALQHDRCNIPEELNAPIVSMLTGWYENKRWELLHELEEL